MFAIETINTSADMLENIYEKYNKQMFMMAFSILNNEQDAEDVVHNVFLKVISKHIDTLSQITCDRDLRNYLLIAVKNTAINMKTRDRKKELLVSDDWHLDNKVDVSSKDFIDTMYNNSGRVSEAIEALDEKYRLVIYLHYVLELPLSDVASNVGQSIDTTKKQLQRGKKKLLAILEKEK